MFSFQLWLDQLVSYCNFVVSTAPRRVWVEGEKDVTSAYNFGEFLVQTLDGLDLDNLISENADSLRALGLYDFTVDFYRALLRLEEVFGHEPVAATAVLESAEWANLRVIAEKTLKSPAAQERLTHLPRF
jgi:hypothetical protein